MTHQLRPSDLAREAGLIAQQIRNLESAGLLPPAERTAAGHRVYTHRHRLALQLERTLVRAGFDGTQRRTIMHAAQAGDPDTALQVVAERFAALDRLRGQVEEVIARIPERSFPSAARRERLRIGEAARLMDVTPGALRHWELERLIEPGRDTTNGYRLYDQHLLRRATLIARLVDLGYGMATLHQVATMLDKDDAQPGAGFDALFVPVRDQIRDCTEATSLLWHYLYEPLI